MDSEKNHHRILKPLNEQWLENRYSLNLKTLLNTSLITYKDKMVPLQWRNLVNFTSTK